MKWRSGMHWNPSGFPAVPLSRGASENFNLVTFGAESPNSLEVIMSFVGKIPEFALGTLTGLATALGAKDVRGRVLRYEREAATYLIEWS